MSQQSDPLLSIDEAAELLGTGPRFPRRLIAERRIEYVKVGRHVRIRQSALIHWVAEQTIPALPSRVDVEQRDRYPAMRRAS